MPRFRMCEIERNTVLFEMEVQTRENKWFLAKKYAEFETLNTNLNKYFHDVPEVQLMVAAVPEQGHPLPQLLHVR